MQKMIMICCLGMIFCSLPSHAWWSVSVNANVNAAVKTAETHNEWLNQRFSEQHKQLVPVVAVADIFFSCNKTRKIDPVNYEIRHLVNEMDRGTLAKKLAACLGEDTMQSDVALNFGLLGCFHEQLAYLPEDERKAKLQLVKSSIVALSHAERKKSFTQCVTEQSIQYLK